MKKHFLSAAVLLLHLASPAAAQEAAPAPFIYNLVNLTSQQCEGGAAIQVDAHPKAAEVQSSGIFPLGDLPYQVNFKRIPDFREWTAAIRLHDQSRGVDDNYVLFTRSGLSPFDAAYVVTRLPDGFSQEQAFQSVLAMQEKNAASGKASFIEADTPFGRGLEMVVGGRVGSTCFPTAQFQYAQDAQTRSIGISHFAVSGSDLIEYALVMPWPEGASQPEAIARAQASVKVFEQGLEATP